MLKLTILPILLLTVLSISTFVIHKPLPTLTSDTSWSGSDFSYLSIFISSWAKNEIQNPYSYAEQIELFKQKYNFKNTVIMPFAWAPVSLVIFQPFKHMLSENLSSCEALFNIIAITLCASCFIIFFIKSNCQANSIHLLMLTIILFTSKSFESNLIYCQTGIYGFALLTFLWLLEEYKHKINPLLYFFASSTLFLILSIKITYLLLAGFILIIHKNYKCLLAGPLMIFTLILAGGIFNLDIIYGWLQSFSFYSSPEFENWRSIGTMRAFDNSSVLRNFILFFLPENLSWQVSRILSMISIIAALAVSSLRSRLISAEQKLTFCFLTFLLFTPYLGMHDEILLLVPVIFISYKGLYNQNKIILAVSLIVIFNFGAMPLLRFFFKLIALISMLKFYKPPLKQSM